MKNLFLSLVLVMVGLVANSQTPQYFYPEYVVLYVLDSLNVPYVPLPERYGVNPMGNKTETTAKGFNKHQNFFKNDDLDSALIMYKKGADLAAMNPLNHIGVGKVFLWQNKEADAKTKANTPEGRTNIDFSKLDEAKKLMQQNVAYTTKASKK